MLALIYYTMNINIFSYGYVMNNIQSEFTG